MKEKINERKGITLIALVITIIVLLILAGISISMLSGDNSILSRAREARDKTQETQKDEEVKIAVLGSYGNNGSLDITKLLENLNGIKDITVTPTQEGGTNTFPVTVETEYTTYEITGDGNFGEVQITDRTGIRVGDYITYTSPTASVTFTDADTGYSTYSSSPATLSAKTLFRVMDIDSKGNMTLVGAMTSSDQTIYFSGAKGYNNAVYTLNKKCSDLYSDTSKGITARSIKVEDITDKFNQKGTDKLTSYIDTQLSSLTTGTYVKNVDTTNRQVTYQTRTNYPDIFQYEAGGLIDGTATSGIIAQSESYSGYNGLTTLANKTPKPTSVTVPYTYYYTRHTSKHFADTERAVAYQNMFFETGTYYWLASRCVYCGSGGAIFRVRYVYSASFNAYDLYYSDGNAHDDGSRVCPVVFLPSSVQVTVSEDESEYHQTVPHVVQ